MVSSDQHIAIGVIRDTSGRILISRRHKDKPEGGKWELPGGKVHPHEAVYQALQREMMEELGVGITSASPLIKVSSRHEGGTLLLDVWTIDTFRGMASGREGQAIQWVYPSQLEDYEFPAINRAILMAIRLPEIYCISPEAGSPDAFLDRLDKILSSGIQLLQFRSRTLQGDEYRTLATQVIARCRQYNAAVLLNSEPELALELGADGVHLTSKRLREMVKRPLGQGYLVAASCHDEQELLHAQETGCDFAVLSPVEATTSHPGATPLGWPRFEELVSRVNMPVYALGGMTADHMETARSRGAQGIAMLSGLWNSIS